MHNGSANLFSLNLVKYLGSNKQKKVHNVKSRKMITMLRPLLWLTTFFTSSILLVHSISEITFDDFQNAYTVLQILPRASVSIHLYPLPRSSAFVLLQAHSMVWNVTLSYDPINVQQRPSRHVTGQDIGLVQIINSNKNHTLYMHNPLNRTTSVLLKYTQSDHLKPIPGGCNLEFPVRIAPYLRLSTDDLETTLEFQKASQLNHSCSTSMFKYDVYYYFLTRHDYSQEEHFKGLIRMSTVRSILKYGVRVEESVIAPHTRLRFLAYQGKGVIYNVIATHGDQQNAYTPISTYDCNLQRSKSCKYSLPMAQAYMVLMLSAAGLFITFKGALYPELQLLLFSFIVFWNLFFILSSRLMHLHVINEIYVGVFFGLLGSATFFFLWLKTKSSRLLFIVNCILLGSLLADIFLFTNVGNLYFFRIPLNFWLFQLLSIMLNLIVFFYFEYTLQALSAAIVGSYLFITAFEQMFYGSLAYIYINFLKRALYDELYQASNSVPFQLQDYFNCALWIGLALLGIIIQTYQSTKIRKMAAQSSTKKTNDIKCKTQPIRKIDYEEILANDDAQEDIDRYNQLTRSVYKNNENLECETPIRSRLRSRLGTPNMESTPIRPSKNRVLKITNQDIAIPIDASIFEGSPSKKLRTPREKTSLLRSGETPNNRLSQSYSAI